MDEDALHELTSSIQVVGLIEPLIGEEEGSKVRVHAGHRRLIAARAAGLLRVPCNVYPAGCVDGEAIKEHENMGREELNPADQAKYYGRLLETRCGGDVDRLCAMVKKERSYVEGRLLLLLGDGNILQALSDRAISIGVANELNKVKDRGHRLAYLDAAMQGGASVRMVRDWRIQANQVEPGEAVDLTPAPLAGVAAQPQEVFRMVCCCCDGDEEPYSMELVYVHRFCKKKILDPLVRQFQGGPNGQ